MDVSVTVKCVNNEKDLDQSLNTVLEMNGVAETNQNVVAVLIEPLQPIAIAMETPVKPVMPCYCSSRSPISLSELDNDMACHTCSNVEFESLDDSQCKTVDVETTVGTANPIKYDSSSKSQLGKEISDNVLACNFGLTSKAQLRDENNDNDLLFSFGSSPKFQPSEENTDNDFTPSFGSSPKSQLKENPSINDLKSTLCTSPKSRVGEEFSDNDLKSSFSSSLKYQLPEGNTDHDVTSFALSPASQLKRESDENDSLPTACSSPNSAIREETSDRYQITQINDEALLELIVEQQTEDVLTEILSSYEFDPDHLITPPSSPKQYNGDETCPGAPIRAPGRPSKQRWRHFDNGLCRRLEF